MNIIFFGNTKYSLIGAKILHEKLGITTIVTIPDRPDKRGRMTPSPLKTFGIEHNIPIFEINKFDDQSMQQIIDLQADFFVVEDYGLILPQKLIDAPKYACLNIHHSLLPKYRGPSPAPTAILNGDTITGVTVMKMAKEVDSGDILEQEAYKMNPQETTDSLLTVLNVMGAQLLISIITHFETIEAKEQNNDAATFTKMMGKKDGFIDLNNPPNSEKLDRMIRAYYPWPTVWTKMVINSQEKIVKLLPNRTIQVEGKNPMSVKDFLNGYPHLKDSIVSILPK